MKNRITRFILASLAIILLFGTVSAGAIVPYTSYTYDVSGSMQRSPHAYVPELQITTSTLKASVGENGNASINAKILYGNETFLKSFSLNSPKDVFVDSLGDVYIANSAANQIVVTDADYNLRLVIDKFTNGAGVPDQLANPSGVYVNDTEVFVADTDNARIVVFDKLGNFVDIVPAPQSEVLPENSVYKPIAVSVDKAGRIYVVSSTTNYGVISLNRDGSFNGFIGPQKVVYSAWESFLRLFQTAKQLAQSESKVSTEFNNLCIDKDGFIYVTTSSIEENTVASAIKGRSKSGDYAPVKRLNPNGSDVMVRNGFWPPSGEIDFLNMATTEFTVAGPSTIVDVALGPNNTWSIIDNKRSRIFTYDSSGNLLFAFGDKGNQLGNISDLVAIDYQGSNMLLLDRGNSAITVFKRTDYGDLLDKAIKNTEDKNYDKAVDFYTGILQRNNNYDAAYVGIAQSMYRNGEYVQAMKYFKYAYNTTDYSEAYQAYRKQWMEDNLWVVPLVVFLVIFGLVKFFKFAGKVNKRGFKNKEKSTFWEEVVYAFHVIFHPFDGFWDLKHEKRGSVRGATFWLAVTCVTFIYQAVGRGYLSNPYGGSASFFASAISILSPVFLWVTANWCLTTLFEGEGSFKDVYVATCYSLVPLPLLLIPSVIMSNFMTLGELDILTMVNSIAFFWLGLLVFFGMMVTHDYTLGKNFLTTIGTVVGVAFIIFIAGLFSMLISKVFSFFYNIYVELNYRWS